MRSDEPGLAECLTGELRVDQTLLRLENGHTPALLNGMVPPSGMIRIMPAGLNRGGSLLRMRSNLHQVLGGLSGRYVVVVDGPQVPGPVPSNQLLSMADATLVVVTEGSTAVRDARFTGDALRAASTNPVGRGHPPQVVADPLVRGGQSRRSHRSGRRSFGSTSLGGNFCPVRWVNVRRKAVERPLAL